MSELPPAKHPVCPHCSIPLTADNQWDKAILGDGGTKLGICDPCYVRRLCDHGNFGCCQQCSKHLWVLRPTSPIPPPEPRTYTEPIRSKNARIRAKLIAQGFITPYVDPPVTTDPTTLRASAEKFLAARLKKHKGDVALADAVDPLPVCLYDLPQFWEQSRMAQLGQVTP